MNQASDPPETFTTPAALVRGGRLFLALLLCPLSLSGPGRADQNLTTPAPQIFYASEAATRPANQAAHAREVSQAAALPAQGFGQDLARSARLKYAPLSLYGTPGLVDMPTARALPDGALTFSSSYFGQSLRNTLSFQITPRLTGSFRYSVLSDFFPDRSLYDRSFDISYLLLEETHRRPALAFGLRDIGGTGVYSSEYVVATKTLRPGLEVTAGIGWGRLGSYGGFDNPLALFSDRFRRRPSASAGGIGSTGQLDAGNWFRGDAAFFGGVGWQINDRLRFTAEYSSDAYEQEVAAGLMQHRSPFNFGLSWQFENGMTVSAWSLYGTQTGVSFNYVFNPKHPRVPGGREVAPVAVGVRGGYALALDPGGLGPGELGPGELGPGELGWREISSASDAHGAAVSEARAQGLARGLAQGLRRGMSRALNDQNLRQVALEIDGPVATLHLANDHYDASAQALGRAARVMSRVLPPEIETFRIVPTQAGMPLIAASVQRADLEELEHAPDGAWRMLSRTRLADAAAFPVPVGTGASQHRAFQWRTGAYFSPVLFDPDNPLRADIGVTLDAQFSPPQVPGLVFAASLRQPVIGNLDQITRLSDSVLPHVRSDAALYETMSDLELSYLTAEYFFRPGRNLYGRVTAGLLEKMYGGISAELLWQPHDSRMGIGAELNYVRQRDYDQLLSFRDYEVLTGHASIYYDLGDGYRAQLDAGRYLAGDSGATLTLERGFANGWRVGAFFTLTDVSFSDFGEGSFDKGIQISVPLSWLTGSPSRKGFSTTIRPVTRDGGARLEVRNRLAELVRGYQSPALNERWGRFWR